MDLRRGDRAVLSKRAEVCFRGAVSGVGESLLVLVCRDGDSVYGAPADDGSCSVRIRVFLAARARLLAGLAAVSAARCG